MASRFLTLGLATLLLGCTPKWYSNYQSEMDLPKHLTDREIFEHTPSGPYEIIKGNNSFWYHLPPERHIVRIGDTLKIPIKRLKKPMIPIYYDTNNDGAIDVICYQMRYPFRKQTVNHYPLLVKEYVKGELVREYLSHREIRTYPEDIAKEMKSMKRFGENRSITTVEYVINYLKEEE